MIHVKEWTKNLAKSNKPNEWEGKQLLKGACIAVPEGRLFTQEEIARGLPEDPGLGFPLVVKVCDPDVLHKTDLGGVKLGADSSNWKEYVTSIAQKFPNSSVLVEQMVSFKGSELIIGALMDPVFGPSVMFGAGGILTELYKDVTFRLAPLTLDEAKRMIRELVISRLFEGYRGIQLDMDSLAEMIKAIGDLVVSLGDSFSQLDLNPVVFDGKKWVALDAVIMIQ